MSNEFVVRNGLISQNTSQVTGSLSVSQGITGSLLGTSSFALNVISASFITDTTSASIAATASSADTFFARQNVTASSITISGSSRFFQNLQSTGSVGFSYITAGPATIQTFVYSPTTGLISATGSLFGTSSLAITSSVSTTASFAPSASLSLTSSFVVTASFTTTASFATSASFARSGSFALTASFTRSGSFAITSSFATTASFAVSSSLVPTASFTISASFAPTASSAPSSSVSVTASFTPTSSFVTVLNQAVVITGSLSVFTGSLTQLLITNTGVNIGGVSTNSHFITGSMSITGSWIATASIQITAQSSSVGPYAWFVGGNMITARRGLGGAGTQNEALAVGSYYRGVNGTCTEEYNGLTNTWAAGGGLINARSTPGVLGTQNLGLAMSAVVPPPNPFICGCTEEYNGTLWSAGGTVITPRCAMGGAGTQNAGLGFGGYATNTSLAATEEYNGTSWVSSGPMITARCTIASAGTQNEGLAAGGSSTSCTEEYNGTNWASGGTLPSGLRWPAGGGTQNNALAFVCTLTFAYDGAVWTTCESLNTSRCQLGGAGALGVSSIAMGGTSGIGTIGATEEFSRNFGYRAAFEYTNNNGAVLLNLVSSSLNFLDDTAAAAGCVPLGGLYRSGSLIRIRLT